MPKLVDADGIAGTLTFQCSSCSPRGCVPATGWLPARVVCISPSDRKRFRAGRCYFLAASASSSGGASAGGAASGGAKTPSRRPAHRCAATILTVRLLRPARRTGAAKAAAEAAGWGSSPAAGSQRRLRRAACASLRAAVWPCEPLCSALASAKKVRGDICKFISSACARLGCARAHKQCSRRARHNGIGVSGGAASSNFRTTPTSDVLQVESGRNKRETLSLCSAQELSLDPHTQ